ncbi:MAG: T9SS type A sorting domain-containing protein [Elusimicrobia bacterium]|nr:T9SS type A sorting domain-containing protein [Elusimicrobiota bacterium]
MTWSSGGASGYSLKRSSAAAGLYVQIASSATLGASAASFLDGGLAAATMYHYRVRGFNTEGIATDYSASTSAATNPPPPSAPALSGVALSTTSVLWSWASQAGVSSYALRAATGGVIVELGGAATTYLESGLAPGTSVAHFLRASNGSGAADSSTTTVHLPSGGVAVPAASSATLSLAGATVTFPAGALGGAGTAIGSPDPVLKPLLPTTPADIDRANRNLLGQAPVPGTIRQFLAFSGTQRYEGNFQGGARATIVIPYPDADGDGVVDATTLSVGTLVLSVLSEGGSSWSALPDSAVDRVNRVVQGSVEHFSIFAILGGAPAADLSNVRIYPNPFLPGQGHARVNIVNLPVNASLRIYTLSGQLVDRLDSSTSGQAAWDGRNESGRSAASGIYWLVVEGAGGKRTLKIAVER